MMDYAELIRQQLAARGAVDSGQTATSGMGADATVSPTIQSIDPNGGMAPPPPRQESKSPLPFNKDVGTYTSPSGDAENAQRAADASVDLPPVQTLGYKRGSAAHEASTLTPTQQKLQEEKTGDNLESAEAVASMQKQDAGDEAAFFRKQALRSQLEADNAQDVRDRRSAELRAKQEEMEAEAEKIANLKVDGDRWQNENGGRASIGLALLGIGGNVGAGLNYMNAQIDRDVQNQKDAIELKKAGYKSKETAYEMMLKRYGTEDEADAMMRASLMKKNENDLRAMAAKQKGSEAEQNLIKQADAIASQRADFLTNHIKMMGAAAPKRIIQTSSGPVAVSEDEYKKLALGRDAQAIGAGIDIAKSNAERKNKANEQQSKDNKDLAQRFVATGPNGQGYLAPTVEEAKGAREQRQSVAELRSLLGQATKLRSEMDYKDRVSAMVGAPTERVKRLQSLGTQLMMSSNKANKLGALDNGTQQALAQRIGEVASVDPRKDPMPQLHQMLEDADKLLQISERGAQGYTQTAPVPAKQGW